MDPAGAGNAQAMHQLGYELPERQGFGGLWEAVAEAAEGRHRTAGAVESEPELVARCEGPTSIQTRRALDAFRRICCDVQPDVDAAA
jgi:hypothetical protein